MKSQIDTDIRFSIVPEWVTDAEVSDRAVRVYTILARYADNDTLQAFPSRDLIAQRARCHVKSVDRALEELVAIGAVVKGHRKAGNGFTSNVYTLRRIPQGRDTTVPRVGTPVSPGRDTHVPLTRTTELELENYKELFDSFWESYPKHLQKGEARKAFYKAVQRVGDPQVILDGVVRMANDPNLPPKQFIPYPATWLNRDGWEDEPFPERDPLGIPGVTRGMKPPAEGPGRRAWVKALHDQDEHWECREGEFGCK